MRDPRPTGPTTLLLCLALALAALPVRGITVEEIPSPRPAGWSVDLTRRVPQETLAEIDRVADEVKARNGAELAVVVVGTTSGVPSRAFATDLFNAWRMGERGKNDGVLVFLALKDRKVEIVLGRGLASPSLREASAAIIQNDMVPLLRRGDPGGAVLAGARACARHLLDVASTAAPAEATAVPPAPAPPPVTAIPPVPAPPPVVEERPPGSLLSGALVILGVCGLAFSAYKLISLATRPPLCSSCRTPMELLAGEAAAAHLTPVEQTESRLGSVRFEIFHCPGCNAVDKQRHRHLLSGYESCPKCEAIAFSKREWTEREATYDQNGIVRVEWTCQNCAYQATTTAATPQLVYPRYEDSRSYNSSSASAAAALFSSSASSSSSSSPDFSSSSSSSSDSGFGGGSSAGDGASGSW